MRSPSLATFDLNLLRTLDVLLRERSVTRAARELNLTQQAASGSLKRLREQFGDPLLVRVGQRLEPTPMALALAAPVREAVRQIALTLRTTPIFVPGQTRRHFRMAMSDHPAHLVMPGLAAELARTATGADLRDCPGEQAGHPRTRSRRGRLPGPAARAPGRGVPVEQHLVGVPLRGRRGLRGR